MSLDTLSCVEPRFRSTPQHEGNTLVLKLAGEANLDATDSLKRVLEGTHKEALQLKVGEVAVDLTELEFLNSSGIKHFVSWLRRVAELPKTESYQIRVVSSALMPWQRRSLEALQCFAPKLISIETRAA